MLRAWRIVKTKYSKDAFSGEGARLYGGRWNSPGSPLVYTSCNRSLAALEMLAHLEFSDLLSHYVVFEVTFDENLVTKPIGTLPKNWDADPVPNRVRAIGDKWAQAATSAIFCVPSAITAGEENYLLNPRHPHFQKLRIGKPNPFRVNPRIAAKVK